MRRDTAVFAVAGVLFGFVAGYMTANWRQPPSPTEAGAAGGGPSSSVPAAASDLDPNEERALVALAERDPENVAARVELGTLYMEGERWDDAIRWLRQALALDPALTDTRVDVGACFIQAGRPVEGLAEEFKAALTRDEGHRTALYSKGNALVQLGRPDEAAAAWEDVLGRYPGDPQLRGLRAQIDSLGATPAGVGP